MLSDLKYSVVSTDNVPFLLVMNEYLQEKLDSAEIYD